MEPLYITEYLESNEHSRWNLFELFKFIVSKTNSISDAETIVKILKKRLECKSKDPNVLKSAQNKARQFSQQLEITSEIVELLENQELIIAQSQEEYAVQKRVIGRSSNFIYKIGKDFEDLYEEKKFKDLTINVENKVFKAHSLILYARSPFFRESLPEACSEITIPKITSNSFEVLLKYMYSGIVPLDDYEMTNLFDLLHAAIKLELIEIIEYLKNNTKLIFNE